MKQIYSIAKFTVKENISNKIFNGFIFFGVFIIMMTVVLRELALYEEVRVVKDSGLFLIEFFVLLITVYTSSTQFLKEKKDKSIYLVLTKPVSKEMYITGRTIGMIMTIAMNVIIMGCVLAGVLIFIKYTPDYTYFYSLLFIILKLAILAAIGVLFSVVSDSYVTSNIFTISVYAAAHGVEEIKQIADKMTNPLYKYIIDGIYYTLPNFRVLNYRDYLKEINVDIVSVIIYTIGYIIAVNIVTNIIFYKKKL